MAKNSLRVSRRPLFLDEEIDNTITVSPPKELDFEYPPPSPPPPSPSPDPFDPTEDLPPLSLFNKSNKYSNDEKDETKTKISMYYTLIHINQINRLNRIHLN